MEFIDTEIAAGQAHWYRLALVHVDGTRSEVAPIAITAAPIATALLGADESAGDGGVRVRYSIARAGTPVHLAIHDVRGRTVWSRVEAPSEARGFELRWDRRDAAGERVPRGVYFVRMQAGAVEQHRKLTLLRP
jgi:hypothetical protein